MGRRPNEAHTRFPRPANKHPNSTHTHTDNMKIRQERPRPVGAAVQADSRGESGGIQNGIITDRAAESRREPPKL